MDFLYNINISTLGTAFAVSTTLIGAYLLILRVRDHFAEKPDPKTTYATIKQLELYQQQLTNYQYENKKDIHNLRIENKGDHQVRDKHHQHCDEILHKLAQKTAQETAALSAQIQMINQRISELSLKSDKLLKIQKS